MKTNKQTGGRFYFSIYGHVLTTKFKIISKGGKITVKWGPKFDEDGGDEKQGIHFIHTALYYIWIAIC